MIYRLFNEKNKDLHQLVKDHVVGGSSLVFLPLSRERGHKATSERVRRVRSTVSVDRRVRCQRSILVVSHARHADGMVHATSGRERVLGAAARTDGHGMVDLGVRTHGTLHTASDQRPRE